MFKRENVVKCLECCINLCLTVTVCVTVKTGQSLTRPYLLLDRYIKYKTNIRIQVIFKYCYITYMGLIMILNVKKYIFEEILKH